MRFLLVALIVIGLFGCKRVNGDSEVSTWEDSIKPDRVYNVIVNERGVRDFTVVEFTPRGNKNITCVYSGWSHRASVSCFEKAEKID
jgi:hypothetical protein